MLAPTVCATAASVNSRQNTQIRKLNLKRFVLAFIDLTSSKIGFKTSLVFVAWSEVAGRKYKGLPRLRRGPISGTASRAAGDSHSPYGEGRCIGAGLATTTESATAQPLLAQLAGRT